MVILEKLNIEQFFGQYGKNDSGGDLYLLDLRVKKKEMTVAFKNTPSMLNSWFN